MTPKHIIPNYPFKAGPFKVGYFFAGSISTCILDYHTGISKIYRIQYYSNQFLIFQANTLISKWTQLMFCTKYYYFKIIMKTKSISVTTTWIKILALYLYYAVLNKIKSRVQYKLYIWRLWRLWSIFQSNDYINWLKISVVFEYGLTLR